MWILLNKNKFSKKIILIAILFCVLLALFINVKFSYAQAVDVLTGGANIAIGALGTAVAAVLGVIAYIITAVVGLLITLMVAVLIQVASYNNIIGVPTVSQGWVIIRDLCNMFFILILLVIAFATILRVESYSAKRLLPKLLIMAVLINFSKTIFGLLIDFSQVIMLTFVNAFKEGGGWFIQMFQTQFLLKIREGMKANSTEEFAVTQWSTAIAIIMGVLAAIITLITITVLLVVLVFRVVMLWIYTILSPLVFFGFAFPPLQKYTGRIWEDFVKQLIIGPMLAFFIWLALTTAGTSVDIINVHEKTSGGAEVCAGIGKFFCEADFQKFIIAIALLIGGLMVTQQIGGVAGSAAGKGLAWARRAGMAGVAGALLPLKGTKSLASYGVDKLHQKTGVDLNAVRVWKEIQGKRAELKKKRYGEGITKAAETMQHRGRLYGALATTGTPGTAWEQLTTVKGWKQRLRGGIRSRAEIDKLAETRKEHRKAIETMESSDNYKKAKEISESLTLEQRNQKIIEQGELVEEMKRLENALKDLSGKEKAAPSYLAKSKVQKQIEDTKAQLEERAGTYRGNEELIKKQHYSSNTVAAAKATITDFESQKKQRKDEIKDISHKILEFKPITDYDAIAARGSLVSDEMKKISYISDMEELSSMLRDSMKQKDKIRFSAIAKKLTMDANENDGVLNNLDYDSNREGLQKFVHEISDETNKDKYVGFTEQEARALGMEISYLAEKNGHWGIGRSFKMEDGLYKESSAKEQATAVASEVAKMDPQVIARQLNRLSYGGESPDGVFKLDATGLAILKSVGNKLALHINRLNPNAAAYLSRKENIQKMRDVGVSPEFLNKLEGQTTATERLTTATENVAELERMGIIKEDKKTVNI